MSRTKTASRKKMSPEQKAAPEKSAHEKTVHDKNGSEKSAGAKRKAEAFSADAFGYDSLARQTLDLWREQLSHFLNNPDAMKDMSKVMEPAAKLMSPQISQMFTPLFSGGMDIWLMMLEQLGKAANMNTKGASDRQDEKKTASTTGTSFSPSFGQGRTENRSAAASALSGASAYAVAQLASRLADLEKRFTEFEGAGKPAAKKSARKKKAASPAVAAVKRVKQATQK